MSSDTDPETNTKKPPEPFPVKPRGEEEALLSKILYADEEQAAAHREGQAYLSALQKKEIQLLLEYNRMLQEGRADEMGDTQDSYAELIEKYDAAQEKYLQTLEKKLKAATKSMRSYLRKSGAIAEMKTLVKTFQSALQKMDDVVNIDDRPFYVVAFNRARLFATRTSHLEAVQEIASETLPNLKSDFKERVRDGQSFKWYEQEIQTHAERIVEDEVLKAACDGFYEAATALSERHEELSDRRQVLSALRVHIERVTEALGQFYIDRDPLEGAVPIPVNPVSVKWQASAPEYAEQLRKRCDLLVQSDDIEQGIKSLKEDLALNDAVETPDDQPSGDQPS